MLFIPYKISPDWINSDWGYFYMKNQIFKDNVEDKEIRFKEPKELYQIVNRQNNIKRGDNYGR